MAQFKSTSHRSFMVALKDLETKQVWQGIPAAIGMDDYVQINELVHHMFIWILKDSGVSFGYEIESFEHKILKISEYLNLHNGI